MKAWCGDRRAGRRRRYGGGTCTSVAADAAGPSRRAGPRSGSGARRGRGAPRGEGWGDTCARCTRHSRGRSEGERWGCRTRRGPSCGSPDALPPPKQKTKRDSEEPRLLETSNPVGSWPQGADVKAVAMPEMQGREQNPRERLVPANPSSTVPQPVLASTPRNQHRTFALLGKPGCLKGMTVSLDT